MSRTLQFHDVGEFTLDSGEILRGVRQAYHLDGALNADRDNLVIVLHALTGSPDAAGDWWNGVIGPSRAIDTDRYAVLSPNLLGSCYGTTGPVPGGPVFPAVTPRDQARLVGLLVDELGIDRVALVTGGSLGGMVALEWNLCHPDRAERTVVLAAPAATPASALGWHHIQRLAIEQGGAEGLALARMVGMMTFRTETEFELRFGRAASGSGDLAMRGYLEHHGDKLVRRFSAESYLSLLGAMDAHDVGIGRGNRAAALGRLTGHVVGVGIPGDRLFSAGTVRDWTLAAGATYRVVESIRGHDAFLLETDRVGQILREALDVPVDEPAPVAAL